MEKPWEVVEFSASRIFGASLPDADDLNHIEIGKLSLLKFWSRPPKARNFLCNMTFFQAY